MPTPTNSQHTLDKLLAALATAVRDGDRARAIERYQEILQCIAKGEDDRLQIGKQVSDLLAELDQSQADSHTNRLDSLVSYTTEDRVWFYTNRKPVMDNKTLDLITEFTKDRVDIITTGRVEFIKEDDGNKPPTVIFKVDRNQVINEIQDRPLVYFHDRRMDFMEAAENAKKVRENLNKNEKKEEDKCNHTVIFSWPTDWSFFDFTAWAYAEATIDASEKAITDFLVDIATKREKVRVFAQGIGNRGLLRALQRIATHPTIGVKFGQIDLWMPDVDRETFVNLAPLLGFDKIANGVTLHTTDWNEEIYNSNDLHKAPRVGWHLEGHHPISVVGMTTVKIPKPPKTVPASTNPQQTIAELLAVLEAAARDGDRVRAIELDQEILSCLLSESADRDHINQQAQALLVKLERSQAGPRPIKPGLTDSVSAPKPVQVWFGTNRKVGHYDKNDQGHFTGERDYNTKYGTWDVDVVQLPVTDTIDETGTDETLEQIQSFPDWKLEELQAQPFSDENQFFSSISEYLKKKPGQDLHSLLFLHGFNNSFAGAAGTAARLGVDLDVNGATVIYSWAAWGELLKYAHDEASIEGSEQAIADFLVRLAETCGKFGQLDVIVHSMGNRGLLRALQRIAEKPELRRKVNFGQIICVAPDVDRDLFLDLTRYCFGEHPQNLAKEPVKAKGGTLYASKSDIPILFSKWFHAAPRAGFHPPYTVNQKIFDSVAVSKHCIIWGNILEFNLGHAYFADKPEVQKDLKLLMQNNPADKRKGFTLKSQPKRGVWHLK